MEFTNGVLFLLDKNKTTNDTENGGKGDNVFKDTEGYVDNPYPYVKHSDVYVCSSRAEGFNTAVSEALILEKAVISTKVSGITEQLGCNNEYGIVVDNTVEGIYYGLKRMMDVKVVNHYKQMASRKSGMFNIDRQMNEIYDVIEG